MTEEKNWFPHHVQDDEKQSKKPAPTIALVDSFGDPVANSEATTRTNRDDDTAIGA